MERFFASFYADMDRQVGDVVSNGIPGVDVDNDALVRENDLRKDAFSQKVDSLRSEKASSIDWKVITDLYKRMKTEIVNRTTVI